MLFAGLASASRQIEPLLANHLISAGYLPLGLALLGLAFFGGIAPT